MNFVWLKDIATGKMVAAVIVRDISGDAFRKIAQGWTESKAFFREELERRGIDLPENDSWDWEEKAATTTPDFHEFLGVATDRMQGMMMLATVPRSSRKPGRESEQVIYIEYLESAPWNLPEYAGEGKGYRRACALLIAAAIERSITLGCEGRLALHSLPGSRLFYERIGFERISFDEAENLEWYELRS